MERKKGHVPVRLMKGVGMFDLAMRILRLEG